MVIYMIITLLRQTKFLEVIIEKLEFFKKRKIMDLIADFTLYSPF